MPLDSPNDPPARQAAAGSTPPVPSAGAVPFDPKRWYAYLNSIGLLAAAQIAMALANVDVLGVHPLAFLTQYGQQLQAQAAQAIAEAQGAQATANTAQTTAQAVALQWQQFLTGLGFSPGQVSSLVTYIQTSITLQQQSTADWQALLTGVQAGNASAVATFITTVQTQAQANAQNFNTLLTTLNQQNAAALASWLTTVRADTNSAIGQLAALLNGMGLTQMAQLVASLQSTASTATAAQSSAGTAGTNANNALSQIQTFLTNAGQSAMNAAGAFLSSIGTGLQNTYDAIVNGLKGDTSTGNTPATVKQATSAQASATTTAGTNANNALQQLANLLSGMGLSSIANLVLSLQNTAATASSASSSAGSAQSSANTAGTNANNALSQLSSMLSAAAQASASAFGSWVSGINSTLGQGLDAIVQGLTGGTSTGNSPASVKTATASTASATNTAGTNASGALSQLAALASAAGQATAQAVGSFLSSVNTTLGQGLDAIVQGLLGNTSTGNTPSAVKSAASSQASATATAGTNAQTGITKATTAQTTADNAGSAASAAQTTANNAQSAAGTAGTNANMALTNAAAAATSASTAQSTAQSAIDAGVNGIAGGAGVGNSPAALSALLAAYPAALLAQVPNPSATGRPVFGAAGTAWTVAKSAAGAATLACNGNHTIATGDNVVVVPVLYALSSSTTGYFPRTVMYGSQQMSSVGYPVLLSFVGSMYCYVEWFFLGSNVPATAKTVTAQVATTRSGDVVYGVTAASASYSGVVSLATTASISGGQVTNANPAQAVNSASNDLVVQAFGAVNNVAISLSGYSQTPRSNSGSIDLGNNSFMTMLSGDAPGAASVSFAATASSLGNKETSNASALNLIGPGTAPMGSGIRQCRKSTTSVAGSAGGPNLIPAGFFDTTSQQTVDLPVNNNAVTITREGWYCVNIRVLLASFSASLGMITLSAAVQINGTRWELLAGNSAAFNVAGAQQFISNMAGDGFVYCKAGDVIKPGYLVDGTGTMSALSFTGDANGIQTTWKVCEANRIPL